PEAEVGVDRRPESQPEPEPQPPAPERQRESTPEPEAVDAETPSATVAPDAAVAPPEPAAAIAPAVEPAAAEPEPAAPAPQPGPEAQPLDTGAFLALPGGDYTVQLAHARTRDGFAQLLASLGLDPASAYALPFDRDGVRWWMLAWSSFPDAASARAAFSRLPRDAGANVGYPRRIALIQAELRP
ncbi:MAG TPA: SPOR domain-containing protein, partial [Xanthomonadales bacterium]|nr:SPOR domain-containing protein [Xanthomonadales bacterium]